MTNKLKWIIREAYQECFNPFIGLFDRVFAIWFLIAVFMGLPVLILGWITQSPEALEMAIVNLLLGCPYMIKKTWMEKK